MDAREAIRSAKAYVADVFADEAPKDVSLEEVEYNAPDRTWSVTIGFSRPWETVRSPIAGLVLAPDKRTYKIVKMQDGDGRVLSMKDRILAG